MWKILLIEDDEDDYILTKDLLSEAREGKYSLQWERNYRGGLAAACSDNHDAILVDNILGPNRGIELIREATEANISAPMILLTGKGRDADDLDAMRAGATDYLDKNLMTTVLLERTIRYAIDQKQSEAALRKSHRQLTDTLLSITDAFLSVDYGWNIRYANQQAGKLAGLEPERLLGKNFWDIFSTLIGTEGGNRFIEAMNERHPVNFETLAINQKVWHEVRIHPSAEGISILLVDITGRKQVEAERNEVLEEMNVAMEQIRVSNEEATRAAIEAQLGAVKLATILNHLTDAVIVFDAKGWAEQANIYALDMLGFNPLQMRLSTILEKVEPKSREDRPFTSDEVAGLYEPDGRTILDLPLMLTSAEGKHFTALYSLIPLDHGSVNGGEIAILKDITAEAEARKQIQDERDNLRALITSMTEGFSLHEIVCDEEGRPIDYRFLEVNPAFERLTGMKRADVIGKLKSEVMEEDEVDWTGIYGQVALTGTPVHFEEYSSALKAYYDVYSYCPAPGQFAVLFMNITERKHMEQDLRVNLTKYQVLFESFPLGITVADADGRILETNQEAERLLGIPKGEHSRKEVDSPDWQIIQADGTPFPSEAYPSVRALKERQRIENVEMGVVKKDQQITWINVTATPLPIEGYGVVVAYSDITDHKRMQAEQVQHLAQIEVQRRLIRQRELERLQVARSLHDGPFQTLNAAHMGLMDAMQQEEDPEHLERLQWVKNAFNQEIDEFRQFIQELRPPALVSFGLETTIRSHLDSFRQLYPNLHIHLRLTRDGKVLPEETRLALYRIYQDIMSNVGRHAGATQVQISLEVTEPEVILEISDDGVGFDVPEQWAELALSDHLGLISMRERAEMIGANLEIQSSPGEGTRVQVRVPRESA